jgi:predicted dehydrogenase/threonine dehydrogenase-like Zn-dependent dehydrogenase
MKQIIQSFKTGNTTLEDVPAPEVGEGQVLIKTTKSLVSLGTEKMLVEFGKANLIQKARQQPDKVKMVLDKIKSDGLLPTLETVFNKLEQPLPLGYCNVGRVIAIGKNVSGFKVGERVASNGPHAEFVSVPQNLAIQIPENVTDEEASFTVVGVIGLQGIRLLNPTLGEVVVVTGLGLIGLITAQLLIANGCKVIGLDVDESKLNIAKQFGITCCNPTKVDSVKFVLNETNNIGADGIIITASAKSNEIISDAAQMSRKRGRIILIGVIGLDLKRADFYEKELSFQVSCSYGPGRYDESYEQKSQDYPLPYVRWTEKRNFEAVLYSISTGKLNVKDLITERIKLENYLDIYGNMHNSKSIASILEYDENSNYSNIVPVVSLNDLKSSKGKIAIVGAGNFTKMTMLPLMKNQNIKYIVSKGGLTAKALAQKHKIPFSSSSYDEILKDPEISWAFITTRHDLHAPMVIKALENGKSVFVEKPLCLNMDELENILKAHSEFKGQIMVGFNRRFSPHIQKIKSVVQDSSPKNMIATMNAGFIPSNVWVHDMVVGGGRIIGEACHFMDLLSYISGSKIKKICMNALGSNLSDNTDNASILLSFENGDTGVINYFSNGNKAYSKERLEIYYDEKTIIMDNFRETTAYGVKSFSKLKTKLDKGHKDQFNTLLEVIKRGGPAPIPLESIVNTTKASFAAIESMKSSSWIDI